MTGLMYKSFTGIKGDRLVWGLDGNRLRILCYHGVCEDRLGGAPWLPSFFVTRSAFEGHLQYLRRNACVLPLSEAAGTLRKGKLPARAVCLTFDDGFANNLEFVYPMLRAYGMSATIFLSTSYMESGELYPFLKPRLVHQLPGGDTQAPGLQQYRSRPLGEFEQGMEPYWCHVRPSLSEDQLRTLRPMTVDQVRGLDPGVIEFGAHTHTHCILSNETRERRLAEIRTSVARVRDWTGQPTRLFSYPNGEAGDFDDNDKAALREIGVHAAVSGIAGANGPSADLLELRRYPITIQHDAARFSAEVSGFRTALRSLTSRHSR